MVVIGDRKKYLSALVTLETAQVINFAERNNISPSNGVGQLCNHPKIIKLIDEEIKLKTSPFADYEQVRRFIILPNDFSIETGELTPTLKIKRKFVEQKYKHLINSMYPTE